MDTPGSIRAPSSLSGAFPDPQGGGLPLSPGAVYRAEVIRLLEESGDGFRYELRLLGRSITFLSPRPYPVGTLLELFAAMTEKGLQLQVRKVIPPPAEVAPEAPLVPRIGRGDRDRGGRAPR